MNLRHLLIFKTVVDTGSFTKAAKQLFITQSGVSHAIRELEQQNKCCPIRSFIKGNYIDSCREIIIGKSYSNFITIS